MLVDKSYREEFNRVASVVDAKFTIRKMYLGYYTTQSADTIGMLAAQVATQDTESLHHLEVERFWVGSSVGEREKLLLQWMKFSKDWVIQTLVCLLRTKQLSQKSEIVHPEGVWANWCWTSTPRIG